MSQLLLKSETEQPINDLVSDALEAEKRELRAALAKTEGRLAEFEQRYGLSTEEFISRTTPPSIIEEMEALEWQGECETLRRLKERLETVEEIEICS